MNFLAHCLLAGDGEGYLAGAVLGDFIKGPIPSDLPAELRAGIHLHRRIDTYSNRLPELRRSLERFDPALRRPAPVLLDILADHCLTLSWRSFASVELRAFSDRAYAALARHAAHAPRTGQLFIERMARSDLLARYGETEVIAGAMEHVLGRLGMASLAGRAADMLAAPLDGFMDDFRSYFPLLQAFAKAERAAPSARP